MKSRAHELINRSCGAHKRRVDGARRYFLLHHVQARASRFQLCPLAGAAVTPDVLKERMADPITWPCGDDGNKWQVSWKLPCALLHRATKDAGRRGLTKVEEERENEECVLVCVCVLSVCVLSV